MRLEHCVPAIKWLLEENPPDKKHVIKICNIPRKATEPMLTKMLQKKIKDLKFDKIVIEKDPSQKLNLGIAWI